MKKTISIFFFLISYTFVKGQLGCSIPIDFFPDDTVVVCDNSTSYQINAPMLSGVTYTWSTGGVSPGPVSVAVNGKYYLTISDGSCAVTDTITVLFNSFLLSPQIYDIKLCKGTGTRQIGGASGQNLLWYSDPAGGIGAASAPSVSTTDTGSTTFWVSQTIRGCESPRSAVIARVITKPFFELGEDFIIPCDSPGITLQIIEEEETDYLWTTGSTQANTVIYGRGKYSLYAQNMCGTHRDTVQAVACNDKCVQFPTAFTPNGDGKNDGFRPGVFCPVQQYRLRVFNRYGELVFETTDIEKGWDGYYKGKIQPDGTFAFYAEYADFTQKRNYTKKGAVMMIK